MRSPDQTSAPAGATRVRVAQALGLVALVAGLIGALGPAERVRTTYSWPPSALPGETPSRAWYTPLLLVRHEPETIAADVPCRLPPQLVAAEGPTVLATARRPERVGGLALVQSERQLAVRLGSELLTTVGLPPNGGASDCTHRVTLTGGRWFVSGPDGTTRQGAVPHMPTVYGLFSALDLRAAPGFRANVTTIPHATRATARQVVAWTVAALAALLALGLVSVERPPGRLAPAAMVRRARRSLHPADAVVAGGLLGWCVLAPVNFDDGWVIQREQMFETSGGFSVYYQLLAANLPLDYWLEWVHHWLAEASNTLVVFRLAVVAVLMAAWWLCRWIAAQIGASGAGERLGTSTLACAFLGGALAWGMTMRPEPFTALFVTAVTACMVRFLLRADAGSVVLAAVLAVLALTAHPAGVVSLAAIVVSLPRLSRWARARLAEAVTVVSAGTALLATLVFVGADLDQRVADAETTRELASNSREEFQRYAFLWEEPFGTPLRRTFVALLLLAVGAFVVRRGRTRDPFLDFPASVVAVGLLLLAATPSKWPSHFGAFIGIGALAIAAETARVRAEGRSATGWRAWPLLAVGAATLASIWAWWEREPWNALDLRTLDWEPAFVSRSGLSQLAVLLPAVLLAIVLATLLVRRRRRELPGGAWRAAAWIPAAVAVPAMLFTVGVLVADAVKTSSWTLTRQNLDSLSGDAGCGLADDVLLSRPDTAQPVAAAGSTGRQAVPRWVPAAPAPGIPRFALGPTTQARSYSPWFSLAPAARAGLFVAGMPGASDSVWLEWGRSGSRGIERLRSDDVTEVVAEPSGNAAWRFFAAGDLPAPHPRADAVRVEYRAGSVPGTALAVTSAVTYRNEPLVARMTEPDARTLVYPELYLYFPCRKLPALRNGVVEVPQHIVINETESPPLRYHVTSPFVGLLDLYALARVPVADSAEQVDRLRVFEVDRRIPGATLVPPNVVPTSS